MRSYQGYGSTTGCTAINASSFSIQSDGCGHVLEYIESGDCTGKSIELHNNYDGTSTCYVGNVTDDYVSDDDFYLTLPDDFGDDDDKNDDDIFDDDGDDDDSNAIKAQEKFCNLGSSPAAVALSTGAIIGIAVGGAVGVALVGGGVAAVVGGKAGGATVGVTTRVELVKMGV